MQKQLTEEDIKLRYVTPAIVTKAGWTHDFVRMEYCFTDGQININHGKKLRGNRKKADYLLLAQNQETPLAIVEAKNGGHSPSYGIMQAVDYAKILDVPFAYSTNGAEFVERDMLTGQECALTMEEFPTQTALWARYVASKKIGPAEENIIKKPYYIDSYSKITPRYYQRIAVDRTVEAVAKGQNRILLVMATGTGKTFTTFQIIWRLKKSNPNMKVLYLADRNILIDQTINNDFKPFKKIITKVKNKKLDSSYEIYMSLYQQLAGDNGEEAYRQFKPEFFDLVIIDECHRGSAKEDSQWRKILDYFSSAIHIGLTATPKETKEVSNLTYFGEPIYTYSLKQGIEDGFLAPYKVIRVSIDKDVEGWRPEIGKTDIYGNLVEDKEYELKDFDKKLIIDERTELVAKHITNWLKKNGRDSKTIIFCVDINHAERMRQALVNENKDIVKIHPEYIMRITGDDKIGKDRLDYFTDVNEHYPTIVTTSKLMTTGVDCKTCKLIVLENNIQSITEFKQIIGRGTRLDTAHNKWFFTIMDFRGASKLFADKDFDGEPVVIIEEPCTTGDDDEILPDTPDDQGDDDTMNDSDIIGDPELPNLKKIHVRGVDVAIINERVEIIDANGKLVTESLTDYTKNNILEQYPTLDDFVNAWNNADKKQVIIDQLEQQGVVLSRLQHKPKYRNYDAFDLILKIAYDKKPLTRTERANALIKCGYLEHYDEACQKLLSALLDKYMNEGIVSLEDNNVLTNAPFNKIGSPLKIANIFGGTEIYNQTIKKLVNKLYSIEAYS